MPLFVTIRRERIHCMSRYSVPPLRKFAYLGEFAPAIQGLADMARPERWSYVQTPSPRKNIILENYVYHTFNRLRAQQEASPEGNYIYTSKKNVCFNTGLFTPNFEPIFALFDKNDMKCAAEWKLKGFYKESSIELSKISPLPERASYFDSISDLMFDTRLEMRINIDHILEDERNRQRIPVQYRNMSNLPMLFSAALEYAKIRVKENYKAAVPQYYHERIQFLLPISLGDPQKVDLSLAVGAREGVYTGHTCLTLDMAYNNARLIAKPESDWLIGS